MKQFDCIVVGGGMVGAASALSLAELGLNVAIIERSEPQPYSAEQAFDLRVSAISLASEKLLKQLGAWQQIEQWRLCPYQRLGVWEQASIYTEFDAKEIEQPHLGHIIENRLIQLALWLQIAEHQHIEVLCPESVKNIKQCQNHVEAVLVEQTIQAKLLIGADGANSQVRNLAGIGITGWDYGQSAMLINVSTDKAQQNITWQQFHSTGPIAMLPMPGNNASLVWYHHKDKIKQLSSFSNEQLQNAVTEHFPERLGAVTVNSKAAFPLTRRHANQYINGRVLLIGDAAHTINPMAGQGVNLGFKDVKALQQVIANAIASNENWSDSIVLARYEKQRRNDNLLMMSTMDALYLSFSHTSPAIKFARNLGLSLVNKLPSVKSKALAYACGI